MTTYFAFRASDELSRSSLTLMENFERGAKEPQNTLFVKVAQLFADEIVDTLLLNLVRSSGSGASNAQRLESFAGIIKSTVNGLIKQVLGKMSNDELSPLSGYIREHRRSFTLNGEACDYIAYETPADFHARFRAVLEKGARGERDNAELLSCMDQFHELSLSTFYDKSLSLVKLGFIGRKLAEVGGSAIRKGALSTSRHSVPNMTDEEYRRFSEYFLGMLITV
ncbi:MAG: hypothetical protein K0S16_1171 [Moraxellaceae bacterium]|jgi:hypothetical protein|nr:hypothetical protein [Moraxellaceae bacterium]